MARLTKSISLGLLGSSLLLAGCGTRELPQATDKEANQGTSGAGTSSHGHGGSSHSGIWYRGSSSPPARTGGSGAIQHGGFGTSGHAVAS
jgi:hypothetical protein